ncbi:hypothetical protein OG738_38090 [Amycolatopsis sp. NBC_01488]|uniref:hypothetical protein n=1 Tax=Amycolatopsis sp. NBC_01488 TaxID=2903563 RepID=UPI002E29E028|nr:hypothetical protein [Amycolatopsis sp. NBC_01488]
MFAVLPAVMLGLCVSSADGASSGKVTTGRPPDSGSAVNLVDYTDNDGAASTVVLTGGIGDFGAAVSVDANGAVSPDHDGGLELTLSQGSFRLDVVELDRHVAAVMSTFPPDRTTCSGTVSATAPTPIVAGSGTGAYRGIKGTFTLTVTIAEVDARANCGPGSAFLDQIIVTAGSGTVSRA